MPITRGFPGKSLRNGRLLLRCRACEDAGQCEFLMEDHITVEGKITTVLPGTMFRVQLDNNHEVLAVISGKMRKRWVRLTTGDRVRMEMSPYDLGKARIVWRVG